MRASVIVGMLVVLAAAISGSAAQEFAQAESMVNAVSKVTNYDIPLKDIKCNGAKFCKVCAPRTGPNKAGGGYTLEWWFQSSGRCNQSQWRGNA
jgi:hypothetical protein